MNDDDARAQGGYQRTAWKEERDKERASIVAQKVRRAAALTAELAAKSEVSEVCSHAPGLHDEPATAAPTASPLSTAVLSQARVSPATLEDFGEDNHGLTCELRKQSRWRTRR